MSKFIKRIVRVLPWILLLPVALYLLFFEGWQDVTSGRYHRKANEVFSEGYYTTRVEIFLLMGDESQHPTEEFPIRPYGSKVPIYGSIELDAEDKKEFLKLWRSQMVAHGASALCHHPAYGFRLYRNSRLQSETSLCWACFNFTVDLYPGLSGFYGFDAESRSAKDLLEFCDARLPYKREDANGDNSSEKSVERSGSNNISKE